MACCLRAMIIHESRSASSLHHSKIISLFKGPSEGFDGSKLVLSYKKSGYGGNLQLISPMGPTSGEPRWLQLICKAICNSG